MPDEELQDQLLEAGTKLLKLPSSVEEILSLLEQVDSCLSRVEQSPSKSMQHALFPCLTALVTSDLLWHSDSNVEISVASCLSEIIRIAAPDAPYPDEQMRQIVQLIVAAFELLWDTSSPSYLKRVIILETVAKVRFCVVMLDLECDGLILKMFQHFFKAIRADHSDIVFSAMVTIMSLVLEESDEISPELLYLLSSSVKEENQGGLLVARKLGEKVLRKCAYKLKQAELKSILRFSSQRVVMTAEIRERIGAMIGKMTALDAPYDDKHMKQKLQLLKVAFDMLWNSSSPHYLQRVSILEAVEKVRSCFAMLGMECDGLMLQMFEHILKVVRDDLSEDVVSLLEIVMSIRLKKSEKIVSRVSEKEQASKLFRVGTELFKFPSSVKDLLSLLDQVGVCLPKVKQSPSDSLQAALYPSLDALVTSELLRHSDTDVKVSVAFCLSEIMRITAPDALYNDDEVKEIFQLIVASFEMLWDTSSRSYFKRVCIRDTVARLRLCVVMLDLECDRLIVKMFQHFLTGIRNYHPTDVFSSMETIMSTVLEESEEILPELLYPLLTSVNNANQGVLPVSRKLGEKVLENCASKLKTYLMQAVKCTGTSPTDYSEIVMSICQERGVMVEHS